MDDKKESDKMSWTAKDAMAEVPKEYKAAWDRITEHRERLYNAATEVYNRIAERVDSELSRAQIERELTKLGAWHVNMVIPFVLPDRLRLTCVNGVATKTGLYDYYVRVLYNNARYWSLSERLDRMDREDKLKALGFENPTEEQKADILACNLLHLD